MYPSALSFRKVDVISMVENNGLSGTSEVLSQDSPDVTALSGKEGDMLEKELASNPCAAKLDGKSTVIVFPFSVTTDKIFWSIILENCSPNIFAVSSIASSSEL